MKTQIIVNNFAQNLWDINQEGHQKIPQKYHEMWHFKYRPTLIEGLWHTFLILFQPNMFTIFNLV